MVTTRLDNWLSSTIEYKIEIGYEISAFTKLVKIEGSTEKLI